jgi:hypothetical protein
MKRVLILAGVVAVSAASQAASLTTLFAGGNGGSSLWTVYFDMTVVNAMTVTSFDVNTSLAAGNAMTIDVYMTGAGGTYVGNTDNAAAWTLMGSGGGNSAGTGNPSPMDVSDFSISPGTYGMAIRYIGGGPQYTNGNGSNQFYSNADLSLNLGAARSTTAGPFSGGSLFSPRVWNGTIYYDAVPEPGTLIALGAGIAAFAARRRRK